MARNFAPQYPAGAAPAEPLQILNVDGALAGAAKPALTTDQTLEALRLMMLGRAFDRKCLSLQRQGRLDTFAPIFGQEATLVGVAMALDPARDWAVPQYRELPVQIRQGVPLETVALYRRGHPDGGIVPPGVKMFSTQVSLAAQLPHAVGLAWGMKMKGSDGVAAVFFGDGASSEGDFHESCNLAGVVDAPVLFVLQNNQWAISTPRSIQTSGADFAARAPAYGFPGIRVDGNDLLAVHKAAAEAVARGRRGQGATLIEAHTYRMGMHTTADDPSRYVDPAELERWKKKDPIDRVQKYLTGLGKWDAQIQTDQEAEVSAQVEEVFARVDTHAPPDPGAIYDHVFAAPTPTLERQRQAHLGRN